MKKKTDWLILLLILIILALIALGAFLAYRAHIERSSHQTLSRMADEVTDQIRELKEEEEITEQAIVIYSPDTPSQPETEEEQNREDLIVDLSPQAETESIPAEMQSEQLSEADACLSGQAGNSTFSVPRSHQVIFVGDSRTVGMGKAEAHFGDHCTYVGESGEGYRWFIEEGIDLMDQAIRKHPKSPVIFNLGVNDCDHIDAYIEVYHEIEKGYPDTSFYYMSVNPVTEESPHVPLSDILEFNRKLKAAFPDRYIDTCSWMLRDGFEDVDGVHYSEEQYCAIHDFAVSAVSGSR